VGRCGVQVIIDFLDIFAVISLISGQTKKALFDKRVLPVPKSPG
jgi:hypothetical protein